MDIAVRVATGLASSDAALWDAALWDTGVWNAVDLAYQDISEYVEEVTYRRGAERWDSRYTAGTATVTLDNTTGLFTPISDAPQPWGVPFRPGRQVQISCIPDPASPDVRVTLFTGRIDDREDHYEEAGAELTTRIDLVDILGELGANNPPALETATGVESTSERVASALDYAGIDPDLLLIDVGVHHMETSYLAQPTLEECQRAADAEGGAFYADPDGRLIFRSRDWLTASPRSVTVQGYLGFDVNPDPGTPEAQIVSGSVRTTESLGRVRNDVQYSRAGGTLQHVEDPDSITLHGRRSYTRTDLNNNSDAEVLYLAERALAAYSEGRLRVEELAIVANEDAESEELNVLFYGVEMGDLVALEVRTLHGWKIPSSGAHVIGIAGRITPEEWRVTFTLDDSLVGV